MANQNTPDNDSIRESIDLQLEMNRNITAYLEGLKKIKRIQNEINDLQKLKSQLTDPNQIREINNRINKLQQLSTSYQDVANSVNKADLAARSAEKAFVNLGKSMAKALTVDLPDTVKSIGTQIDKLGLFKMDKAIKQTALGMGLLGQRAKDSRKNISDAAESASDMGITLEEVAQMQGQFSDEIGRSVSLTQQQLEAMSQIAKATGLGVEGSAKLTAEMEMQGTSAESIRDTLNQTMEDASKMGLNASKVVKNISGNIKMLNKYNFKEGIKGLAKMAATVTKLGIDMNTIEPMAEKVFDIEGAAEMAAQLQVLGGGFSQLGDMFKLMYQGQNDIEGLTNSLAEAASQGAKLNKEKDGYDLSTVAMRQLRAAAKATGVEYDKLATMAKKAAQLKDIKQQIKFNMSDEAEEFIANTSYLKDGKAYINIKGEPKLLSELDTSAKSLIESEIKERKNMEERAKAAQSFDERLNNFINKLKITLLPFIEGLEEGLLPAFDDLLKTFKEEKWGESIKSFGKSVGQFVGSLGGFIIKAVEFLGPTGTLATWGALKAATWFLNGIALGKGFNSIANVGGGGSGGNTGGSLFGKNKGFKGGVGRLSKAFGYGGFKGGTKAMGRIAKSTLKGNALVAGLSGLLDVGGNLFEGKSIGESLGRALFTTGGSLLGGVLGSFLAPGAGTIAGGIGGGIAGENLANLIFGDKKPESVDDGVVFNPKDKFMKVNDSTMIAGTDEGGNKSLAKAIMSSVAPGFGLIDYLMDSKSKLNSTIAAQSQNTSVTLSDLNVKGAIELKLNGETTSELSKQLLNNPMFIRELSKLVNMATASAVSGTQPQRPK